GAPGSRETESRRLLGEGSVRLPRGRTELINRTPHSVGHRGRTHGMGTVSTRERTSVHPLDLLTAEEIESAATILRQSNPAFAAARFVSIGLDEPPKEQVLAHADGDGDGDGDGD